MVYGEDFLTVGTDEDLDTVDAVLEDGIYIKKLGRIGPGAQPNGRYLLLHIEWLEDRFVKGQPTPGSAATGASIADPEAITGDEAHTIGECDRQHSLLGP